MPPQYILYARKSSESEDRQVLSIDSQIRELQEFARTHNLTIAEVLKESRSAKAPGRPIFNEMMKAIHRGKAQGIVCWKLDRLARNPVDGGALIWALDQGQLKEIQTPNRAFHKSGDDAFWMQLEFGMAKKYVDDLSDNVKRGLRAKAEKGEPPCSRLPIGYWRDPATGKVGLDPRCFELVKRLWREVAQGFYRPIEVLERANSLWGFRTPSWGTVGGSPLSKTSFYRMLANPFYTGVYTCQGEVYPGRFPALVATEEFRKVQAILKRKDNPRPKSDKCFAYRGLLGCGGCLRKLTAEEKYNRHGSRYVYYHCARTVRTAHLCHEPFLEERTLEAQAVTWLGKLRADQKFLKWAEKHVGDVESEEEEFLRIQRQTKEKTLRSLDEQIRNLRRMRLLGHITDEEHWEERQRLLGERVSLEKALSDTDKALSAIEPLRMFFSFVNQAQNKFASGDQATRRQILLDVGSNFWVEQKILRIEAQKPFQLVMERPAGFSVHAWWDKVRNSLTQEAGLENRPEL